MQKVLVTGASVGIGRQTAVAFAKRGALVAINYRQAVEDAKETLRLVEQAGGKGILLQADVSDEAQAAKLVADAAEAMEGLDVLVNNAGVTKFIPFTDLDSATEDVWTSLYKTNVESMFFCCRAAAKVMQKQEQGGAIVNLASVSGLLPTGSSIPYSVTKAAIVHLTKCLARTLSPKIRVNAVAPGIIVNTRWNAGNPNYDPSANTARAQGVPLKRLGEPEDIAEAIVFLASDAASYITGSILPVEGGLCID
jgi:3-oxoacyl-[acyl-carrier protein] reductase